jgi:DNA-binding SARP family transcriptional activator
LGETDQNPAPHNKLQPAKPPLTLALEMKTQSTQPMAHPHLLLSAQASVCTADGKLFALSTRDALLLAWLVIEGPQPRSRLAALLWPDASLEVARNTLRQRLFNLKRVCNYAVVQGNATLSLAPNVSHDLQDALTVLGHAQLPECAEFDAWLNAQRQRRLATSRDRLAQEVSQHEAAGDFDVMLGAAQSLLLADPLSEHAHRCVIRAHYLRDDRASALLAFDRCAELLKDEVGAQPSAQTLQLLELIGQTHLPPALVAKRAVPVSIIRPPKMIGRGALRQQILHDLNTGSVAVLVGEAGMGKSRMLADLGSSVGRLVSAAARPGDTGVPFASLARLLREVLRRCPALIDEVPRQEMARFMPELGLVAPGSDIRQRQALEHAVQAFVRAASKEVDVLAFDDLHFADEASLDMLQTVLLSEQPSSLRWLLALRPADAPGRTRGLLDSLAETGLLAPAVLEPLTVTELAALVDSLAVPGLRGERFGAQLHQQSGGNPLFALETLKHLVLSGAGTETEVAALLPRPTNVLSLIERRLNVLSPSAIAVARVAAICGTDFSIDAAEHVLEQPALTLADAWGELEQAQVLRDSAFAHDLVFEAVLHTIPAPIANHTHARVAQYLDKHGGEPSRIAQHWLQAEKPALALPWLKAAAQAAGRALRSGEQVDFLLRAATIEEELGAPDAAFESLRAALEVEGKGGKSLDMALSERLQALAQTPLQHAQASFVRMRQAAITHRYDETIELGQRALKHAERAGDTTLPNNIRQQMAAALAYSGKNEEAVQVMLPLEAWIDTCASVQDQAEYHGNLACVLDNLGRLADAVPHHNCTIDIARSIGWWSHAASGLGNLAINRMDAGNISAALLHLQESEQIFTMYEGEETQPPFSALSLSICARTQGLFADALRWAETGLARGASSPVVLAMAQLKQVEVWLDLGQYARGTKVLDGIVKDQSQPFFVRVSALCSQALAQRLQGRPSAALLEEALTALPTGVRPDLRHRLLLEKAFTLAPLQALALTETVMEEARNIGHEGTVMAAWARRSTCLWKFDPTLALAAAKRALELAQTHDSPALYRPELWLSAARAMQESGQDSEASHMLALAHDWIKNCISTQQVPPEFADSFLHRNPVNRDVLSLYSCAVAQSQCSTQKQAL